MLEFLAEYGLFLLKALTIVIAIIVVISFAAAADRVYYMNDVGERGMIDGTTHLPWGLPVPAAPSLAAGAGALPAVV